MKTARSLEEEILRRGAPATRIRRGRVVEIPEQWRGRTTHPQTIRKRKVDARVGRGNGKGSRETERSGYASLPTRRVAALAREIREQIDGAFDDA